MAAAPKLAIAAAFVFAVVLLPRTAWPAYAIAAVALLAAAAASQVPLRRLGARLAAVEPFALGVALLSLLQRDGFLVFLALLTKSTLCLACVVLLGATTRFSEVLRTLSRLRVPPLLVTTLALLYRYLYLLVEEMGRMQRARRGRTFTRGRWFAWRSSATVIAHLFLRTSERAERIYAAMCARGWRT
jgi:cobalt/nickel transport system permease protein